VRNHEINKALDAWAARIKKAAGTPAILKELGSPQAWKALALGEPWEEELGKAWAATTYRINQTQLLRVWKQDKVRYIIPVVRAYVSRTKPKKTQEKNLLLIGDKPHGGKIPPEGIFLKPPWCRIAEPGTSHPAPDETRWIRPIGNHACIFHSQNQVAWPKATWEGSWQRIFTGTSLEACIQKAVWACHWEATASEAKKAAKTLGKLVAQTTDDFPKRWEEARENPEGYGWNSKNMGEWLPSADLIEGAATILSDRVFGALPSTNALALSIPGPDIQEKARRIFESLCS
jgi:hypothetical protein